MSSSPPAPLGACLERAGFLFAHDCSRPAHQRCTRCAKAICAEHGHAASEGLLCTGCFQALLQKKHEEGRSRAPERADDIPPTLYSSYYYRGHGSYGRGAWGHDFLHEPEDPEPEDPDPDDFTEADSAVLGDPKRGKRYEKDMGGS